MTIVLTISNHNGSEAFNNHFILFHKKAKYCLLLYSVRHVEPREMIHKKKS